MAVAGGFFEISDQGGSRGSNKGSGRRDAEVGVGDVKRKPTTDFPGAPCILHSMRASPALGASGDEGGGGLCGFPREGW